MVAGKVTVRATAADRKRDAGLRRNRGASTLHSPLPRPNVERATPPTFWRVVLEAACWHQSRRPRGS